MIYHSNTDYNCMEQMIDIYEKIGLPVISMHTISKNEVVHYGIMTGKWEDKDQSILRITKMTEKPTVE